MKNFEIFAEFNCLNSLHTKIDSLYDGFLSSVSELSSFSDC